MTSTGATTTAQAPAWPLPTAELDGNQQLTTLQGWRKFTATTTIAPELLTGPGSGSTAAPFAKH